jgi:hypothetical protein
MSDRIQRGPAFEMSRLQITSFALIAFACLSLSPSRTVAQATTLADSLTACDYRQCALTIAPRWNGLAVVRGTSGRTVANLNFFAPHDIGDAFERHSVGSDSVAAYVQRAVRLRRVGAVFTDVGILSLAVAGTRALRSSSNRRTNAIVAATGLAALGVSVPFQFAADGALSRAVWWHNLRYARTHQADVE